MHGISCEFAREPSLAANQYEPNATYRECHKHCTTVRHGMSLRHEDSEGSVIFENVNESHRPWPSSTHALKGTQPAWYIRSSGADLASGGLYSSLAFMQL